MRAPGLAAASRASRSPRKPSADRGGVSRPSSRAWTTRSRTPARWASSATATRWRSLAWTPPGPTRLTRASRRPVVAAVRQASTRTASVAKLPSAMAASMRGRSWRTGRPAPRFRWPTSELPICPSGSPTSGPDAPRRACGQASSRARQRGIRAAATASASGRDPIPKPSRMTRTMGRGRTTLRPLGAGCHRPAAAPARALAVSPARATIPAISSTFRLAPPTRAPSMPGSARNSPMAALVTLPP